MVPIDHEITLKTWKFILNSIEKVKPGFLLFSMCVSFLNWTGQNLNLTAFTSKNQVFCRPEWTPWKWILTIFKSKDEFLNQLGLKKQMKQWVYLPGFHVFFLRYGPYIVLFCFNQQKIEGCYNILCMCIWKFSFCSFRKRY